MKALLVVAVLAAPAVAYAQSYEIAPPAAPRPSWPDGVEATAGLSTGGLGSNAVSGVLGGLHLGAGLSFGAVRLGAEYDLLGLAGSAPAEDTIEAVGGRVSRLGLTAHLRRMIAPGLERVGIPAAAIYLHGGVGRQQVRWDHGRRTDPDLSFGAGLEALLSRSDVAAGADLGARVILSRGDAMDERTNVIFLVDFSLLLSP